MCSMACGLRNSSKIPPVISRIPSRPLSTRPILNVLSSAGDTGGAGGSALVGEAAIGSALPFGLGMLSCWGRAHGVPVWDGRALAVPRGDQGGADHEGGRQRAE